MEKKGKEGGIIFFKSGRGKGAYKFGEENQDSENEDGIIKLQETFDCIMYIFKKNLLLLP